MIQALLEVILVPIFEVAVRLPGYLLLRCFYRPSDLDIESNRVGLAGLLLWGIVAAAVAFFFLFPPN